jgi:putative protease
VTLPNRSTPSQGNRRAELLLPAGDLEKLRTAVLYGADAVYAGTPDMSLRTQSGFTLEDLREGVVFAHQHGRRVYLTLNLFPHNKDVEKLPAYVETLRTIGPDGVIVADLGVFHFLREHAPELELHVSTQANAASFLTVQSWQRQGAALCVLAREVSFAEMREIRQRCPDIRLETFVHGSMCMTYSGRCLLSNYMAERGANQGSCAHSCRWKYQLKVKAPDGSIRSVELNDNNQHDYQFFLEEELRPGQLFPIEEDASGSYILNSRDLCLMPKLDEYLALGLDSLKVEGRNKSAYYVAVVGRAYRLAIDAYYREPSSFDPGPYLAELATVASRGYTLGFHTGRMDATGQDLEGRQSISDFEFAGVVREHDQVSLVVELRNRLKVGDILEFLPPGRLDCVRLRLYEFENAATGERSEKISAGEHRAIRIAWSAFHSENLDELKRLVPPLTVVRKAKVLSAEETEQLARNRTAQQVELGRVPAGLSQAPQFTSPIDTAGKPRRLGADSCCGLGCNGCLPFWNDDKYTEPRERLLASDRGKLLKHSAKTESPSVVTDCAAPDVSIK